MTVFSLVTVSFPEFFLSIVTIILLIDGKRNLYVKDCRNVFNFFVCLIVMLLQTFIVRAFSCNIIVSFVFQLIIFIFVLKVVYFKELKLNAVIFGVLGYVVLQMALELVLVASPVAFWGSDLFIIFQDDIKRLFYSIPVRISQIAILVTIWKWKDLKFIKEYGKIKIISIVVIVLLLYGEITVIYCFLSFNLHINIIQKIALISLLIVLAVVNILFIYVLNHLSADIYNTIYSKLIDKEEWKNES